MTCKICRKQNVGSTIAKFWLPFNLYKSNMKLYWGGRRNLKQEKLIEHFYSENHNDTYQDINVKIVDFCDPNDQGKVDYFRMNKLRILYPEGLHYKQINHYSSLFGNTFRSGFVSYRNQSIYLRCVSYD